MYVCNTLLLDSRIVSSVWFLNGNKAAKTCTQTWEKRNVLFCFFLFPSLCFFVCLGWRKWRGASDLRN